MYFNLLLLTLLFASTVQASTPLCSDLLDDKLQVIEFIKAIGDKNLSDSEVRNQLAQLIKTSPHLKDAATPATNPHSIITTSFEKEGRSDRITFYFKGKDYTDEEWFKLPAEVRGGIVHSLFEASIVPTQFKPDYLGHFDHDVDNYTYEVRTNDFFLTPKELLKSVNEIGKDLEFQDLHTHIVFEIPLNYEPHKFSSLIEWVKHQNDYLLFSGLEEGLHPNDFTAAATLSAPTTYSTTRVKVLPRSLDEIGWANYKKFAMGLRTQIYGKASIPSMIKLGFELRDFTHNESLYRETIKKVIKTVETEGWLKSKSSETQETTFNLDYNSMIKQLKILGFDLNQYDKIIKFLYEINKTIALPFGSYEQGYYQNYSTGMLIRASPEQTQNLHLAMKQYVQDLKDLSQEIANLPKRSSVSYRGDIDTVIKMNLSTWAKKAKMSELFKN